MKLNQTGFTANIDYLRCDPLFPKKNSKPEIVYIKKQAKAFGLQLIKTPSA